MVGIEGLSLAVELEQQLLQALQEALVPDIRAGVMDKHTGFHVACGVEVAVNSAASYASTCKLTIVLEVDAVQFLATGKSYGLSYTRAAPVSAAGLCWY